MKTWLDKIILLISISCNPANKRYKRFNSPVLIFYCHNLEGMGFSHSAWTQPVCVEERGSLSAAPAELRIRYEGGPGEGWGGSPVSALSLLGRFLTAVGRRVSECEVLRLAPGWSSLSRKDRRRWDADVPGLHSRLGTMDCICIVTTKVTPEESS